jgi:tetratricopeptide (TPR) repeat protein
LHDNTYYAVDGLALQVEYAGILMIARPERVEESIALLEGVRDELFRIAFQPIVSDWSLRRGQAEIIAGRPEAAAAHLAPLADDAGIDLEFRGQALLFAGDAEAMLGCTAQAAAHYDRLADLLRVVPDPFLRWPTWLWRHLGDRYDRIGRPADTLEAYRSALAGSDLPPTPTLPPCPER